MVTYPQIVFNVPLNRRFSYSCEQEVFLGSRVKAPFGKRRLIGCVVAVDSHPPEGVDTLKSVESLVDKEPLFGEDTLELAQWMANLCMCSLGEALFSMLPGGKRESKKLQEEGDQEASSQPRILTDQQQVALDGILSRQDGWNYLYGLTGSGKTEVFLRAAEATIEEGRGVIYLVPEIALSHQLVDGLKTRFPGKVAVIHSGLTPSRRLAEWNRIRNGEAPFVLGARSAVFAPLPHLGLLILDEEHEGSYKSGSTPRYHARQVAMRRSRVSQARLLMGSATPSVESWFLMNRGSMTRHTLTGRPAGGAPPTVQVVNLAGEQNVFSKTLVQAMSRVLGEGRQVLLFLNRRGFSYQYACQACGEEVHCRHCSVPLTYHKARRATVCHYCGYRTAPPHSCPECGSVEMRAAGFGTERIEE
ncbi:MAG: primosomal protein N', partial [Spirochaetales bacterium]|nr:primosomal protein N' [Spirochaetales bacterium]